MISETRVGGGGINPYNPELEEKSIINGGSGRDLNAELGAKVH